LFDVGVAAAHFFDLLLYGSLLSLLCRFVMETHRLKPALLDFA
jgi:hypothetical protein